MLFPCYLPSLNPSLRMENEESSWPVVDVRERRKLQNKASPIIPPAGRGENEERRNISASQTQLQLQASLTGMGKSSMEREGPASTQSSQAKARLPRRGPWARSLLCWSLPSHPLSPSLYVSRSISFFKVKDEPQSNFCMSNICACKDSLASVNIRCIPALWKISRYWVKKLSSIRKSYAIINKLQNIVLKIYTAPCLDCGYFFNSIPEVHFSKMNKTNYFSIPENFFS